MRIPRRLLGGLLAHEGRIRGGDGPRTPHKSPIGPIYAFPELFRGQILAIHIQTFGKIFRTAVLTRRFAISIFFNLFLSALFCKGNTISGKKFQRNGPFFAVPISPSSL